jgi:DNA-directed RNA polymerase specialized sigma24 family protein
VRLEPQSDSPVIGYLIPGLSVQARLAPSKRESSKGSGENWLYVRYHNRAKNILGAGGATGAPIGEWGFSVRSERGHVFLVRAETYSDEDLDDPEDVAATHDAGAEEEGEEEEEEQRYGGASNPFNLSDESSDQGHGQGQGSVAVWQELFDEVHGHPYYYCAQTGESRWEAPEWVEETDVTSGANYYVKVEPVGAAPLHSTWSRPKGAQVARLIRRVADS